MRHPTRLRRAAASATFVALAALATAPPARGELAAIWAVDDGTKVKADELGHRLQRKNGIFDGERVRLFGARNETVAFQIILQGGKSATPRVSVALDALGSIANAKDVSDDPDRYFVGRRIELFAQHYALIRARSRALAWKPGSDAEPAGLGGPVPDALVPLRKPIAVAARRNQGIWIDVYVPKGTPARVHRGTLSVRVDGKPCLLEGCALPVELEVLPLTLGDEPRARAMVTFSGSDNDRDGMPARYLHKPWDAPEAEVEALRARHFKLLRRHRITGFLGHDKQPTEAVRRRLSGETFRRAAGYEGPAEGLGQDVYSIFTYASGTLDGKGAQLWRAWLARHAPRATYFYYVADEPGRDQFAKVNQRARQARPVPAFVTRPYDPGLGVDIFCALPEGYSLRKAAQARAAGKRMWIYNGVRPFSGSFVVDDAAVATRVNPWIQHKHGIERWFYWESTYYKDDQGKRGQIDVWTEANNYRNWDNDRMNGDGLLLYPGRDVLFPKQDRGFDGPLPSIRLKNWRRGIEDVEYLVLAERAGHKAFVQRLLATLVPRALADDVGAGERASWPDDGEKWLAARRKLADLLRTGKAPAIDAGLLGAPPEPVFARLKRGALRLARRIGRTRLMLLAGAGGLGCVGLVAGVSWLRKRKREHAG